MVPSEFDAMGQEGAVRLAFRKELETLLERSARGLASSSVGKLLARFLIRGEDSASVSEAKLMLVPTSRTYHSSNLLPIAHRPVHRSAAECHRKRAQSPGIVESAQSETNPGSIIRPQ